MPEEGKVIPVRVALRCRPLVPKEESEGCKICVKFVDNEPQIILGKDKTFTYDYSFTPETPQSVVYEHSVAKLVEGFFKGYNATVLAYGQTGSGKTFTMGGGYGECSDPHDEINGIIPRVIRDIFKGIEDREEEYDTIVKVSYIELYKEDLHDLLQPISKREPLQIREEVTGGIKLVGLTEKKVSDALETLVCLEDGASSRTTGATAMNSTSSRSHAIFTVHMERTSKKQDNDLCRAKFHLVDLAGSERAKRTQAEGERFKEGVNINKGLLALGNVISALGEEVQKRGHIPYRDSKLTRLLQDSLGGNSYTVMIACISPADSNMEETLSTLRYADRARKIKNKPIVNRDPQAAEIMRLRQVIQDLQSQMLQGGPVKPICGSISSADVSVNSSSSESLKLLQQKYEELEEEKYQMERELRTTWAQNHILTEQNISLEMSNEKLSNIINMVKEKTGMSVSRLETTQTNHNPDMLESIEEVDEEEDDENVTTNDHMSILKDIHQKITDCEKEEATGAPVANSPRSGDEAVETMTDDEQLSRQADYQRRLAELNDNLHQKQDLVNKMMKNYDVIDSIKEKYEADKVQLSKQIEDLNSERETLLDELESAKKSKGNAASKVAEQRRKRLKELEEELGRARKTLREQAKMVKMKEQSDQQLKKMTQDIKEMKQNRVKLLRQMKEEADRYRQWKQAKDKEVIQLKAKDRKRQLEMVKLKQCNERQQSVFRRKAEEAAAANKRLKEALARQKSVQDERNKKQQINDASGIGARVRKWLSHEVEVLVSVQDAKNHLESLKQDRSEITKQLKDAKKKLEDAPSPSKKRKSDGSAKNSDASTEDLKKEIQSLETEIELRSSQISELQEKVMDANQDEKSKSRWQNVHTMVEAKCALKFLLDEAVGAKLAASKQESKVAELNMKYDELSHQSTSTSENLKQTIKTHEADLLVMRNEYENKILYLLNQLNNSDNSNLAEGSNDEELKQRLKFQEKEIERFSRLQDEVEELKSEKLKVTPTATQVKATKGQRVKAPTMEDSKFFSPALLKRAKKDKADYQYEDYEEDDDIETDDDDDDDDDYNDPDWKEGQTPGAKVQVSRTSKRRTMTFKTSTMSAPTPDFISPPNLPPKDDIQETEAPSVLDTTYSIDDGSKTDEALTEISSEDNVQPKVKDKKKTVHKDNLLKENSGKEKQDILNGGVKKKRKLMNVGRGFFASIE